MNSVLVLSRSRAVHESLRSILSTRLAVELGQRLADARTILATKPVDVVIIDTELRDCDGAEALRTIARECPGPSLVALTLGEKLNGKSGDRSLDLFAYLTKPFDAEQVRFVVDRAVERAELRRRITHLNKQVRAHGTHAESMAIEAPHAGAGSSSAGAPEGELRLFRRCATIFAREAGVPALTAALVEAIADEFFTASAAVLLWDSAAGRFMPAAAYGLDEQAVAEAAFLSGRGVAGWLARTGVVLRRSEIARSFDADDEMAAVREFDILRAHVAVPLMRRGTLLGFISIGRKVSGRPTPETEIDTVALVANMAAVAIENAQAREALEYEKHCAEHIVSSLDIGIVVAEATGVITTCNRAAIEALGLDRPPVGEDVRLLGSALAGLADESLETNERLTGRAVRHETSGRRFDVTTAPVPGDDGPAGVVLVLHEAAAPSVERVRAGRAEEMEFWSELAGRMAHKIKNPLVSIKTFTQLLPERYEDDDFRKSFLDVVDAEADKINEITDRLALYSAAHEMEPVPTDLGPLVERALDAFTAHLRASGVHVEQEFEDLPVISADPERLTLALHNVIENALDAMEEGGRLTVRTRLVEATALVGVNDRFVLDFTDDAARGVGRVQPEAYAAVEVSDSGSGIAHDRLKKVFLPFLSDKVRGVGLGLAIVARIMREHGGRVEVVSTPGSGTCVRLLLPAAC